MSNIFFGQKRAQSQSAAHVELRFLKSSAKVVTDNSVHHSSFTRNDEDRVRARAAGRGKRRTRTVFMHQDV